MEETEAALRPLGDGAFRIQQQLKQRQQELRQLQQQQQQKQQQELQQQLQQQQQQTQEQTQQLQQHHHQFGQRLQNPKPQQEEQVQRKEQQQRVQQQQKQKLSQDMQLRLRGRELQRQDTRQLHPQQLTQEQHIFSQQLQGRQPLMNQSTQPVDEVDAKLFRPLSSLQMAVPPFSVEQIDAVLQEEQQLQQRQQEVQHQKHEDFHMQRPFHMNPHEQQERFKQQLTEDLPQLMPCQLLQQPDNLQQLLSLPHKDMQQRQQQVEDFSHRDERMFNKSVEKHQEQCICLHDFDAFANQRTSPTTAGTSSALKHFYGQVGAANSTSPTATARCSSEPQPHTFKRNQVKTFVWADSTSVVVPPACLPVAGAVVTHSTRRVTREDVSSKTVESGCAQCPETAVDTFAHALMRSRQLPTARSVLFRSITNSKCSSTPIPEVRLETRFVLPQKQQQQQRRQSQQQHELQLPATVEAVEPAAKDESSSPYLYATSSSHTAAVLASGRTNTTRRQHRHSQDLHLHRHRLEGENQLLLFKNRCTSSSSSISSKLQTATEDFFSGESTTTAEMRKQQRQQQHQHEETHSYGGGPQEQQHPVTLWGIEDRKKRGLFDVLQCFGIDDEVHSGDELLRENTRLCTVVFALLFLLQVFVNFDCGAVPASLTHIGAALDLSPSGQGVVGALPYVGLTLASLCVGKLLAVSSPRRVILISMFLNVVAMLLLVGTALLPVPHRNCSSTHSHSISAATTTPPPLYVVKATEPFFSDNSADVVDGFPALLVVKSRGLGNGSFVASDRSRNPETTTTTITPSPQSLSGAVGAVSVVTQTSSGATTQSQVDRAVFFVGAGKGGIEENEQMLATRLDDDSLQSPTTSGAAAVVLEPPLSGAAALPLDDGAENYSVGQGFEAQDRLAAAAAYVSARALLLLSEFDKKLQAAGVRDLSAAAWLVFFSRLLVGVTQAPLVVYAPVWIYEFAPLAYAALWMGIVQGAAVVGVTVGYLTTSFLTVWLLLDWRWSFLFQALLVALLVFFLQQLPPAALGSASVFSNKNNTSPAAPRRRSSPPPAPSSSSLPLCPPRRSSKKNNNEDQEKTSTPTTSISSSKKTILAISKKYSHSNTRSYSSPPATTGGARQPPTGGAQRPPTGAVVVNFFTTTTTTTSNNPLNEEAVAVPLNDVLHLSSQKPLRFMCDQKQFLNDELHHHDHHQHQQHSFEPTLPNHQQYNHHHHYQQHSFEPTLPNHQQYNHHHHYQQHSFEPTLPNHQQYNHQQSNHHHHYQQSHPQHDHQHDLQQSHNKQYDHHQQYNHHHPQLYNHQQSNHHQQQQYDHHQQSHPQLYNHQLYNHQLYNHQVYNHQVYNHQVYKHQQQQQYDHYDHHYYQQSHQQQQQQEAFEGSMEDLSREEEEHHHSKKEKGNKQLVVVHLQQQQQRRQQQVLQGQQRRRRRTRAKSDNNDKARQKKSEQQESKENKQQLFPISSTTSSQEQQQQRSFQEKKTSSKWHLQHHHQQHKQQQHKQQQQQGEASQVQQRCIRQISLEMEEWGATAPTCAVGTRGTQKAQEDVEGLLTPHAKSSCTGERQKLLSWSLSALLSKKRFNFFSKRRFQNNGSTNTRSRTIKTTTPNKMCSYTPLESSISSSCSAPFCQAEPFPSSVSFALPMQNEGQSDTKTLAAAPSAIAVVSPSAAADNPPEVAIIGSTLETQGNQEETSLRAVDMLRLLLWNPLYLLPSLTVSALLFVVTGVQFWSTAYLTEELLISPSVAAVTFSLVAATAPILGVLLGGAAVDALGGSHSAKGRCRALRASLFAAACAVVSGLIGATTSDSLTFTLSLWFLLCFGAALLPPLTGIQIAAVDASLRTFASGLSMFTYNIFGYALGTFLPGVVMDFFQGGDVVGMRLILGWSVVGFAGVLATLLHAERLLQTHAAAEGFIEEEP